MTNEQVTEYVRDGLEANRFHPGLFTVSYGAIDAEKVEMRLVVWVGSWYKQCVLHINRNGPYRREIDRAFVLLKREAYNAANRNRFGNAKKKAFTLIELLVTISIIALFLGLGSWALKSAMDNAKLVETRTTINNMMAVRTEVIAQRGLFLHFHAIQLSPGADQNETYWVLAHQHPTTTGLWNASQFTTKDVDNDGLEEIVDGWGNPMHLTRDNARGLQYKIISAGRDGVLDTEDDITSEQ